MHRILTLKEENPLPPGKLLPESFDLSLSREQSCATAATFDDYAEQDTHCGACLTAYRALSLRNRQRCFKWLEQGATYTARPPLSAEFQDIIQTWEEFLNDDSLKMQLAARYIYEHLFLFHLHFPEIDERKFFRMVRSTTPPGEPS